MLHHPNSSSVPFYPLPNFSIEAASSTPTFSSINPRFDVPFPLQTHRCLLISLQIFISKPADKSAPLQPRVLCRNKPHHSRTGPRLGPVPSSQTPHSSPSTSSIPHQDKLANLPPSYQFSPSPPYERTIHLLLTSQTNNPFRATKNATRTRHPIHPSQAACFTPRRYTTLPLKQHIYHQPSNRNKHN